MTLFLRRWAILNFLFLLPIFSFAQEISEIIKLNKENLHDLYGTRGVSAVWLEGDVNESDIAEKLMQYDKKIGIIIYTMLHDSLNVTLLTREGKVFSKNTAITADSLVNAVNLVNRYFSLAGQTKAKRGIVIAGAEKNKNETNKTIAFVNNLLLPDKKIISGWDHLVVVPTLNIASIPFYALKLNDTLFLVEKMSYSIAPSLYEIMVSQHVNQERVGSVNSELKYTFSKSLIVADPDFSGGSGKALPQLPGTKEEADQISKDLGENHFLYLKGKEATHEHVMSGICDYDLLYFATHGIVDAKNPLDSSYLALAHGERLTARDIQNIRKNCMLQSDLVILSACQTGLGGSHLGGTIGLARAFQIAGANHVVTSLWNIDDRETAILMSKFFDELKVGGQLMPHEALRRAILAYRKTTGSEPYYWAPFSIFGLPY